MDKSQEEKNVFAKTLLEEMRREDVLIDQAIKKIDKETYRRIVDEMTCPYETGEELKRMFH